jgi:pyruvate dehydrogenase E1 component beta subunit
LYSFFTHIPGLKVVIPSSPYDAKGLLIQAIRDDDPVVFLEHTKLYDLEGEVPADSYVVPFGEANVLREGGDLTIVALARMTHMALGAAQTLASKGIEATVIDPRTTSPLDEETILESIEQTGRLLVVDESNPRCSVASEVAAVVAERGFRDLKAPIRRVTAPHTPVPFSPVLENAYIPGSAAIEAAALELVRWS